MNKIFILAVFLIAFVACDTFFNNHMDVKIVAEVGGKKLTVLELQMAIPSNVKQVDSISFAQNYIEKWVKNQLLLDKAEMNLDRITQQSIGLMIDNYRTSLMLFKYQQMIIQQKLDTIVTSAQIEEYYNHHSDNFKLDSCVVKCIYVQLPKSQHNRSNVRKWIRSKDEDDIITLEDYCYQNARNFNMGEDWKYFGSVLREIPRKIDNQESYLKRNRYIESTDSLYAYYVVILDYRVKNDITPVVFVKDKIYDIIINHRKVKLIEDLENNIYNDAVDQKKFIIHTN